MTTAKFAIGDKVNAIALPNGVPTPREAVTGLTVTNVRYIISSVTSIHPYYRITAEDWPRMVEGAERFFEPA